MFSNLVGVLRCPVETSNKISQQITRKCNSQVSSSARGKKIVNHRALKQSTFNQQKQVEETLKTNQELGEYRLTSSQSQSSSTSYELDPRKWILSMGWIASKLVRSPSQRDRLVSRWTSYRKLRRCKKQRRQNTEIIHHSLNVNHKNLYNNHTKQENADPSTHIRTKLFCYSEEHYTHIRTSDKSHLMGSNDQVNSPRIKVDRPKRSARNASNKTTTNCAIGRRHRDESSSFLFGYLLCIVLTLLCLYNEFHSSSIHESSAIRGSKVVFSPLMTAEASLIIGDSAIEIQEVGDPDQINQNHRPADHPHQQDQSSVILGSTSDVVAHSHLGGGQSGVTGATGLQKEISQPKRQQSSNSMPGPLPPIAGSRDDITDGDKKSRNNHDYDINELNLNDRQLEKNALSHVLSGARQPEQESSDSDKAIAGKVVDFELTPAGGHNKAKIKKKKKKKEEEGMFKKWGKKKKSEKKAMEKKHKEEMKKKKEEGKKKKKKWGHEEHGQKKKGKFKKKKWGKKVKKGKGVKKGKKGKKFLVDKGHKNNGFKTVYHKEEWGKSSKWHDIKREKKWDEKSKKWKKKWKKEKGKKYKGDHMKKFEKKKKEGKKYKKEKQDKFKKFKKEEFKKGKKKKMEEHGKKKEGGSKKEKKEMKKKKKKG